MSESAAYRRRFKRLNPRQWWHRLTHRLCWNCNVPLVPSQTHYASDCPNCGTRYPEVVMLAHERKGKP